MQELTLPFKGTVNDLRGYIGRFSESYARNTENTDDIFLADMAWPEKREAGLVIRIGTFHSRSREATAEEKSELGIPGHVQHVQHFQSETSTEGWLEVVRQTDQQSELIGHFQTVEAEKFVKALMREIELNGLRAGAMPAQPAAGDEKLMTMQDVDQVLYPLLIPFAHKFKRREVGQNIEYVIYSESREIGRFILSPGTTRRPGARLDTFNTAVAQGRSPAAIGKFQAIANEVVKEVKRLNALDDSRDVHIAKAEESEMDDGGQTPEALPPLPAGLRLTDQESSDRKTIWEMWRKKEPDWKLGEAISKSAESVKDYRAKWFTPPLKSKRRRKTPT